MLLTARLERMRRRAGEETGLRFEDDGVVDPPSDVMDLRPVNLDSKKLSLQDLYPPAGEETGHLDSKNYRFRTYTPMAGEETGLR
jgi:hypothetical protein